MKTMDLKEFKEKSNIEIIEELIKINNGYITSNIVTELGIHRMYLKIMLERKLIKKVGNGIYADNNTKVDDYYILNLQFSKIIFSHMSALYLHGLINKPKNKKYDISIPNKYHDSKLQEYKMYFVSEKNYKLGLTTILSPLGNEVNVYDVERSICDIIKYKENYDIEDIKSVIKKYLKSENKDLDKLYNYAKILRVKGIDIYIDLLK